MMIQNYTKAILLILQRNYHYIVLCSNLSTSLFLKKLKTHLFHSSFPPKAECMSTDTTQLNPTQLDMYWLKTQLNSTGQICARRREF